MLRFNSGRLAILATTRTATGHPFQSSVMDLSQGYPSGWRVLCMCLPSFRAVGGWLCSGVKRQRTENGSRYLEV